MNIPNLGPERLPDDPESATPGRYASVKKHLQDREKGLLKPADERAKPSALLSAGVFIPEPDEK